MNKRKQKRSKHQKLVNDLESRLRNRPYVHRLAKNVVYQKGEEDIHYENPNHSVYIEVKLNHTKGGYYKAHEQLQRWTEYQHKRHKNKNFWGVYYTSTYIEVMYKNGKRYGNQKIEFKDGLFK